MSKRTRQKQQQKQSKPTTSTTTNSINIPKGAPTRWLIPLDKDIALQPHQGDMSPPGYNSHGKTAELHQKQAVEIKIKKAWDLAKSPFKSIIMVLIMIWMSPNTPNIFSISIMVFALWNPLKAILTTNAAFAGFEGIRTTDLLAPKALYVLINLGSCAIAVWKVSKFGLIPTTPGDYIAWYGVKQASEFAGGGAVLT